ncbi:hypothetical protein BJY00DRAFT_315986 [Aspergillus carlsbadensis]|nr:hypothetical protein BJY00DRAFT_315986 [Aspergillus carlsbadensis]
MSRRQNQDPNDIYEFDFPPGRGLGNAPAGGHHSGHPLTLEQLQAQMGGNRPDYATQMWSVNRANRGYAADQYGEDLGQDFGDQGLDLKQGQGQEQQRERRGSWDQVEDQFSQPQSHLTRDQFQSLSGLGNETSQTVNPRDRPRKLHQDMQGDTAVDPYDVGDVGDNRGSRTQEEVEEDLLYSANPE